MDTDKHFQVIANKGATRIEHSEKISFLEANWMSATMQLSASDIVLVDTKSRIAQLVHGSEMPFAPQKDWEYVPKILPEWMRIEGMNNILNKLAEGLQRVKDKEIKMQDLSALILVIIDAAARALQTGTAIDGHDEQLTELHVVLLGVGADEQTAQSICFSVLTKYSELCEQ